MLSVPSRHAYPLRLREQHTLGRPAIHHLPDPPVPGAGPDQWWPPPALTTEWIDEHAEELDVVHVHFGFDARTPDELTQWCETLDAYRIPLVLTVHDVVNPHFVDQTNHRARLEVLLRYAVEVMTLTSAAADEIYRESGRRAEVLPHPYVAPLTLLGRPTSRSRDRFRVGLHLKSLRANVVAGPVVRALVAATHDLPGADLSVHLHREVLDPGHPRHDTKLLALLAGLDDEGRIALTVHEPHTDAQLWEYLSGLDLSVLPYAFGSHSGWLEACFDLGTPVLAPRTGYWTEQQRCATFGWDALGPHASEIAAEVAHVHAERPVWQATRAFRSAQQRHLAARHRQLYRRVTDRLSAWKGTA
ncbi:MAG: glycosyltransferase family 1 protein [Lapillicoccus sp.]